MKIFSLLLLPSLALADPQKEALALLSAWVDAQNRADAKAYEAFYDHAHFKGVKRTARGGKKEFDCAGWLADRLAMLKKHPKVEASAPSVTTWQDKRMKLKPGVIAVRFLQRWKTDRYADHGVKVLHLLRGANDKLVIIYEDLLNSEAGWDARAGAVAKLVLTPPASDEAAAEIWRKIAPTGATLAEKLAAIPADARVTRPLARALLAGGNFACDKVVRVDECGDESVSWQELDPKAGLDDPCLRRRLALWALSDGQLSERDLSALAGELQPLTKLPAPEDELPEAVMSLVDGFSKATRLGFLHAAPAELAEKHLEGLPAEAMAELYRDDHLDAAAMKLDGKRDRALLLDAVADERLEAPTRNVLLTQIAELKGADVAQALGQVADGATDCALAMSAAEELAQRGDKSHLPRRPAEETAAAFARALCLLVHDGDKTRQLARYKEFLPPKGKVTLSEQIDDDFAERDAEGNKVDSSPEDEHFSRKSIDRFNIDDDFGKEDKGGKVETSDGYYQLSFERGSDGKLYLKEIHRYRWRGCPC
jgi:hypothetical protein